jgi:hypothetical protein
MGLGGRSGSAPVRNPDTAIVRPFDRHSASWLQPAPDTQTHADPGAPGNLGALQSFAIELDHLGSLSTCRGLSALVFPVLLRLGINVGDVLPDGTDVHGDVC